MIEKEGNITPKSTVNNISYRNRMLRREEHVQTIIKVNTTMEKGELFW